MPSRVQLEKLAWQWAEQIEDPKDITTEHVETAYHLNLQPCATGACRRKCKGNPFCLNGLGEKSWFKELDESRLHDFDPENERRKEGHFVGLKNLGATCYVNTFLQLCFHNPKLCHAVWKWRDPELCIPTGDNWKPSSICGHLQLLFALLKYSKRAYIDPSPLIECLGLDKGEQQDAQEFSKLFLSVLEGALLQGSTGEPCSVIQQQFAGTYSYITRCQKCGSESSRDATFYELDISIQGHSSLLSSLQGFLKEEKLEGENQYMCSVCNSKQNAVRSIELQNLPPVLHLQLLRFVFDVKKGQKKKLNSYLIFGDVLDMSPFLNQEAMTTVYDLTAVLIHRGPSAYSGHYVAHIQHTDSKLWYRFNDEEITIMKGKKLQLGQEEEIIMPDVDSDSSSVPKIPKGSHSSKDAYMLVYSRRLPDKDETSKDEVCNNQTDILSSGLPKAVVDYILQDNGKFEEWIQEIIISQDATIFNQREQQKLVQCIYRNLQCTSFEGDCEWIPVNWLCSWLANPEKCQPIDISPYLCHHGKLHPDAVVKTKLVSTVGADYLYENYGGTDRLTGKEGLCLECVRQRWREIQFKGKLADYDKFFTAALKQVSDSGDCYWVGKHSLRWWKRCAVQELGDYEDCAEEDEGGTNGNDIEMGEAGMKEIDNGEGGDKEIKPVSSNYVFNAEILCVHGALHPDESCRRLIPAAAWNRFSGLFPTCPKFQRDDPVCDICLHSLLKEQEVKEQHRQLYSQQKELLQDLFTGKNRPKLNLMLAQRVFIVSSAFIDSWRKHLRNREGVQIGPLESINNKSLLCDHGRLLYPVPMTTDVISPHLVLVWESEWEHLVHNYHVDVTIEVFPVQEEEGDISTFTIPELCEQCMAMRLKAEEEDQYIFEQEVIFVRKMVDPLPGASQENWSPAQEEKDDPDFEANTVQDGETPVAKRPRLDESSVRKSQRHRKQRGEKELRVSSNITLRDFKIKVMNLFSIATFDQNLSIDGRPITDSESTLRQLRFYPGCLVIVKADVPNPDSTMENISARKPEEGFKGTSLVSS